MKPRPGKARASDWAHRLSVSSDGVSAALRALRRAEPRSFSQWSSYKITDVKATQSQAREIIFLQQRWMGLPVYGGRRSIVRYGRSRYVTGSHLPVRTPAQAFPTSTPAEAVAAALDIAEALDRKRRTKERFPRTDQRTVATLMVTPGRRPRFVWHVKARLATTSVYEVLLDATTFRPLRARCRDHQAVAHVAVADLPTFQSSVDAAWLDPDRRRFRPLRPDETEWPWPPESPPGKYVPVTPEQQMAVNVIVLVNTALEELAKVGGAVTRRVDITMATAEVLDLDDLASASVFVDDQSLKFMSFMRRHAATDASVVLHELAHLVLCHGVGGRDDDSPFETSGESAAVGEGLADALALTMWNARLRAMSAPEVMSIGEWVLRHRHRDYAAYLPSNGRWSGSDKYKRGQALCAALLEFRSGTGSSPDEADEEMWRTVCGALHALPHQLDQPKGCCISETLLREASAAHRGALDAALRKRGVLAGPCPHIKRI